jgi:hypothetical protein
LNKNILYFGRLIFNDFVKKIERRDREGCIKRVYDGSIFASVIIALCI